ncbi:hypothetical protein ACTWPB_26725 [Nocardia sp. IBHARD005]|uniref:hypothetical protein n=1 Tax=Nocardia sp. IBHARD005 TaxID=3457765 RepID=UPI004058D39E
MSSRYWAAATASTTAGLVCALIVLAGAARLDDRDIGRLPMFALILSGIVAVATAATLRVNAGSVRAGIRRGMFTTSALLAGSAVLAAWLYGGFWQ